MDLDRLYIHDLLDTATRGHLAEPPAGGTDPDGVTATTQAIGEEGDDPDGGTSFDDLPFTSGPADPADVPADQPDEVVITSQALGEEGDDPEDDAASDDAGFSTEPNGDGLGDDVDDNSDDDFGADFGDDDVIDVG